MTMRCHNYKCPFYESGVAARLPSVKATRCTIADAVQEVRFRKGEILFIEGQSSSSLYSLTSGMAKICCHTTDGREQIVGVCSPEKLLLGLQSINDEAYAYTATATTAIRACKITHKLLLAQVQGRPELGMRLINALNCQLAHSRALIQVLGHKCAAAKIASFILLLTPRAKHGNCQFTLPFSRMEIASFLGLREETVCRVMANMKRAGAIYAPRGNIEIRDWNQLHAIVDGSTSIQRVA